MLAGQWQWGGMESAAVVGAGSSSGSMGRSRAVALQIGQHSAAADSKQQAEANGRHYMASAWDSCGRRIGRHPGTAHGQDAAPGAGGIGDPERVQPRNSWTAQGTGHNGS